MRAPAVILDVDGTLVDSNDAHARAWVDAFAEAGISVSPERVRRAIGMGGDKLMAHAAGLSDESPEGRRISERRREIFAERYLPDVRAFPGVRTLVSRFARDGFTIVVASSAREEELGKLLEVAGVADLIRSGTSSDDVERSKPDPDIVAAALKQSGAPAGRAIMLGDTPYDVEAARRAGVRIVGLECGGWGRADLQGAAEVYAGPEHLYARYESSLFARERRRASRPSTTLEPAVWWIAAPLVILGAALAVDGLVGRRRRRGHRRPVGSIAPLPSAVDDEPLDAPEPGGTHPRLGPRDRARLRRIIERTS